MKKLSEDAYLHFIYRLIEQTAPEEYLILLESQLRSHPSNRYTYFASNPDIVISACGHSVRVEYRAEGRTDEQYNQDPWQVLKKVRKKEPGWYFGYLGYDLKNHTENLQSNNRDIIGAPDLVMFRPSKWLIYDHKKESLFRSTGFEIDQIETFLFGKQMGMPLKEPELVNLSWLTQESDYLERIRTVQQRIREGDFYEINLSHVLMGELNSEPLDLYRKMKQKGAVPFACYMQAYPFTICCSSPERFLCRNGNRIYSQPVKGTAPRHFDPNKDQAVKERLRKSEKERAENLMIVDLVRHDLSRIAIPGSIQVPELYELYSFETVHQLISTVEGKVRDSTDSVDILKSCFPMGSMTGAPKISAMKVIEELEDYKRGIYSGAIGYIRPDGNFDFNVVIRTAIVKNNQLFYPAGGAITSDSVPENELKETFVKVRALTNSMEIDSK